MQDLPQPNATSLDYQGSDVANPILEFVGQHDVVRIVSATAAAASKNGCPISTLVAPSPSCPSDAVAEVHEDNADLDIDDTNVLSCSARKLPM